MAKKLTLIAAFSLAGLSVISAGIFYMLQRSLPVEEGQIKLTRLLATVSVSSDAFGIPTIKAQHRNDAYQVLGFLHARDRLFQMELMRRKSGGRLAEIFGSSAITLDKNQRDYQFEHVAQQIVAALPDDQRQVLTAYTMGVNDFLATIRQLPPEFIALQLIPEPWRPEDSILTALAMFQILNGQEQDERMVTVMQKALPKTVVDFLTPDTDIYATALVGGKQSYRPAPPIPVTDFAALEAAVTLSQNSVAIDSSIAGSNNWVIAGSKTHDGRTMVANDMHLSLAAPNIWYRAQLHYPNSHLNGVTLPGLPVLIVGSNDQVSWGFTNATADLLDLISLNINPNNPNQYLTPQGWQNFSKTKATLKVKNSADIPLELVSTVWGPVSSQPLLGRRVAIKWTALEIGAVDLGLLNMDKALSVKESIIVMNQAGSPPQNVVLADRKGHIGWTLMGHFPKRQGFDGLTSQSWADDAIKWDDFIPTAQLPRLYDPPEGFIATANNRTLGNEYPYITGYNWGLSYRAYRISQLLRQSNKLDEAALLAMQLDTRSEVYDFYQQLALKALSSVSPLDEGLQQSLQSLRAWQGHMDNNSQGAALLVEFRNQLAQAVFAKVVNRCRQYEPTFNYAWREMETPLRTLLNERPKGVLPTRYQDDWQSLIVDSLKIAAQKLHNNYPDTYLSQLTWGTVNRIKLQHPFSHVLPTLSYFLDIADFESSGCASVCVKVMSNQHGASERLVVSPSHQEDGILEMPGGQSGHFLSKHYRDQQQFWQQGQTAAFLPGKVDHELTFLSKPVKQ